jgi:hypothetical protein
MVVLAGCVSTRSLEHKASKVFMANAWLTSLRLSSVLVCTGPWFLDGLTDAQATWRVDLVPLADIGSSPVDPADQLGLVFGSSRFSNGRIAILDASLPAVRIYTSDGRHIRDIGREGSGPGEFREPIALATVGDSVVVLEREGEVEWIAESGRSIRTVRVPLVGFLDERFNARPSGVLPDGSIMLRGEERLFGRVTGEYRQTVGLLRVVGNAVRDTLGWFRADSGRTAPRGVPIPQPYIPETGLLWTGARDRVFVATADVPHVRAVSLSALPAVAFQIESRQVAITEADVREVAEAWVGRGVSQNDRRVIREFVDARPRLRRAPALRSLVAFSSDEVWIELWARRGPDSEWLVYSAAGVLRARVFLPAIFRVQAIGADWVLGTLHDASGTPHVRLHRLHRR